MQNDKFANNSPFFGLINHHYYFQHWPLGLSDVVTLHFEY